MRSLREYTIKRFGEKKVREIEEIAIIQLTSEKIVEILKSRPLEIKFPIRSCGLCGYLLGYLYKNNQFCFDRGCSCVTYIDIAPADIDDLIYFIHSNKDNEVIQTNIQSFLTEYAGVLEDEQCT